jgi:hypothetical protein
MMDALGVDMGPGEADEPHKITFSHFTKRSGTTIFCEKIF